MTTDTEALTGTVTGRNRDNLIGEAERLARLYYGTSCVTVRLDTAATENETIRTWQSPDGSPYVRNECGYTARFVATIEHTWPKDHPVVGTIICQRCGQTTDAMLLGD